MNKMTDTTSGRDLTTESQEKGTVPGTVKPIDPTIVEDFQRIKDLIRRRNERLYDAAAGKSKPVTPEERFDDTQKRFGR